jgi:hypothetical protein
VSDLTASFSCSAERGGLHAIGQIRSIGITQKHLNISLAASVWRTDSCWPRQLVPTFGCSARRRREVSTRHRSAQSAPSAPRSGCEAIIVVGPQAPFLGRKCNWTFDPPATQTVKLRRLSGTVKFFPAHFVPLLRGAAAARNRSRKATVLQAAASFATWWTSLMRPVSTSKIKPRTETSLAIHGCDLTFLICSRVFCSVSL